MSSSSLSVTITLHSISKSALLLLAPQQLSKPFCCVCFNPFLFLIFQLTEISLGSPDIPARAQLAPLLLMAAAGDRVMPRLSSGMALCVTETEGMAFSALSLLQSRRRSQKCTTTGDSVLELLGRGSEKYYANSNRSDWLYSKLSVLLYSNSLFESVEHRVWLPCVRMQSPHCLLFSLSVSCLYTTTPAAGSYLDPG